MMRALVPCGAAAAAGGLSATQRRALNWVVKVFPTLVPRVRRVAVRRRPVVVFTDVACEETDDPENAVGVGAVIFPPGRKARFVAIVVPQRVWQHWQKGASPRVIGQAEVFPALLSRFVCAEVLCNSAALFFVGNDSARHALIARASPVGATADLLWRIAEEGARLQVDAWYERIAPASNLVDLPSLLAVRETAERFRAVEDFVGWGSLSR
mmetsp:Transcript_146707/g.408711  ORF Transcript_146707/g.408711 Transcript_146707/m.408711 type:complete len:211 (+) Transcript_146707:295-927(+)